MTLQVHHNFVEDKSLAGRVGPALNCTRAGATATYRDSNGVRQTAAANEPRFDHDANGVSLGLLIEEERTNLFLNSDAPVTQGVTTAAATYTVWMEGTGSVTLSGTGTGVATEGSPVTVVCTAGTLTLTIAGSVDLVQVEQGAYATSYIPTAGSSVTRNLDLIETADVSWFSGTAGTIYGEGSRLENADTRETFMLVPNSGNTHFARVACDGDSDPAFRINQGGSAQMNTQISNDAFQNQASVKMALAWQTNDGIGAANGALTAQDTVLTPPTTITSLDVGRDHNGPEWDGHVKEIAYWDERLADSILENITVNGLSGARNYIAVTRRRADQMIVRPRMPKPRNTLRGKFE